MAARSLNTVASVVMAVWQCGSYSGSVMAVAVAVSVAAVAAAAVLTHTHTLIYISTCLYCFVIKKC